jgi:hypothetical protein
VLIQKSKKKKFQYLRKTRIFCKMSSRNITDVAELYQHKHSKLKEIDMAEIFESQCIRIMLYLPETPTTCEEKQRADKILQISLDAAGISFARMGYLISKSQGSGIRNISRETIISILGWKIGQDWTDTDLSENRAMVSMRAFNLWLYELSDLFETSERIYPAHRLYDSRKKEE